MSNMSYCRWQNTLADLQDCMNDLENRDLDIGNKDNEYQETLSREEVKAAKDLLLTMVQVAENFDESDIEDMMVTWDDNNK